MTITARTRSTLARVRALPETRPRPAAPPASPYKTGLEITETSTRFVTSLKHIYFCVYNVPFMTLICHGLQEGGVRPGKKRLIYLMAQTHTAFLCLNEPLRHYYVFNNFIIECFENERGCYTRLITVIVNSWLGQVVTRLDRHLSIRCSCYRWFASPFPHLTCLLLKWPVKQS